MPSLTRNALALGLAALILRIDGWWSAPMDTAPGAWALLVPTLLALLVSYLLVGVVLLVWDARFSQDAHLEQVRVVREGHLYRVLARRFLRAADRQRGSR
ncbi:MAG: hypothetical protein AAFZ65_14010 [Planctomycetota bacterium]